MNLATAVVIAVIGTGAVMAAIHLLHHPESGSCDGTCNGCALKGNCNRRRNDK